MPFGFKEADYSNTFPAEVIESVLMPIPNDPTREMWQMTLLRLRFNAGKNDWEPMETPYPCQLPGCVIQPWHNHIRFYESDRAGSPSHKFVQSITSNTNIALFGPGDILHKRFTWSEEIWPSRPNPQTGTKGKDQYYYFVKSMLGSAPPSQTHEDYSPPDELPFDSGTKSAAATNTAATEAPTNGTVATAESDNGRTMTIEEATLLLAGEVDGKNKAQIQQIIMRPDSEYRKVPGFLVAFMQNKVRDALVKDGFVTEDEQGIWHAVAE